MEGLVTSTMGGDNCQFSTVPCVRFFIGFNTYGVLALWKALYLARRGGTAIYRPLCSVYMCIYDLGYAFGLHRI